MIGAKVVATLVVVLAALGAAAGGGALAPERLLARGFGDLFLVGGFGALAGTLVFGLFRLGERSHHYFRFATDPALWEGGEGHFLGGERRRITVGVNQGEAFDLPAPAQHALCVVAALLLGLFCLPPRALGLLAGFVDSVRNAGSYCPDTEAPPEPSEPDVNAAGCELIRRAFELGYAESLGDCAPKKKAADEPRPICRLRQRDEPLAHYSYRLLAQFWAGLARRAGLVAHERAELETRLAHLSALAATERQMLASAPHASHHVFTNLADPGGAFRPTTCGDRYRWLAHRPPAGAGAGAIFEHVLAQLLFEARYEPAAAACREVHVHFGQPRDVCARLQKDPLSVLRSTGALASVRAALERHRLTGELAALGGPPPAAEPAAFLSFQCYIEGDGPAYESHPFQLDGHALTATEVRVPPSPAGARLYTDRYDAIARLLVPSFHYGALLSEAGLEPAGLDGIALSLGGRDFLLSRLYSLGNADLYLEPGFLAERPDLLEVYPYQLHLKNYVQMFRRQLRTLRGRL